MRKSIIAQVMVIFLSLSLVLCACQKKEEAKTTKTPPPATISKAPTPPATAKAPATLGAAKTTTVTPTPKPLVTDSQKASAIIDMKKGGRIAIEFYPKDAPNTIDNFIKLANKGFYDGLKFHRVEPGFVVQGGDPSGDGSGGPGYTIKDEFNSQKHITGTVAMAKTDAPNSAGSQFYICFAPQSFLDGNYTVFGQVVEGMDIVNRIQIGDVMSKVTIVNKATLKKASK